MKANEAPEKLYLISDEDGVMLSYDPSAKLQYGDRYDFVDEAVFPIEEGCEVEYVRKDAFIEKACEWFKNNWREYVNTDKDGVVCFGHWEKDFEKYMEGENE